MVAGEIDLREGVVAANKSVQIRIMRRVAGRCNDLDVDVHVDATDRIIRACQIDKAERWGGGEVRPLTAQVAMQNEGGDEIECQRVVPVAWHVRRRRSRWR